MTDGKDIVIKPSTQKLLDEKSSSASLIEPLKPDCFPHVNVHKNGTLKPKCTIENVAALVDGYGFVVRYNVMSKEVEITGPGICGVSENNLNTAIETINSLASLNDMPIGQVPRYLSVIADRNLHNPVADWITGKPWDGVDRIEAICNTLVVREGFPDWFKAVLVKKWLLSAVAAATMPSGFHARGILTLQGKQGLGKTSWVRQLIPESILRDNSILTGHHLDPSNKDSQTTAIKYLIVELGELDSSFKKDVARIKGFVTQDKDTVRRPYARTNSEYQRRTVFCASVNEENFLIDQTGNSRFWTLPLVEIDYHHQIDMQQVFAQLYVELQEGAIWWLTPEEDEQLAMLNQAHRSVSAIEERVLAVMNSELPSHEWRNKSATEVLQAAGYRSPTNPQTRECGGVLRAHWGEPKKIQGIMKWKVPLDPRLVNAL